MRTSAKYFDSGKDGKEIPVQLKEITHFARRMMSENDPVSVSKEAMRAIANQFGMTEMVMALWDDESRRFRVFASHGYPPDMEKDLMKYEYGSDWITDELQEKFKIAEDIYFINAEDWTPAKVDNLLLNEKEKIDKPREYENQWVEKDFFELVLRDHDGNMLGAMELNDSEEDYLPDFKTLLSISIYLKVTAILLEIAASRNRENDISRRSESLTRLMSHDIGESLRNAMRFLETIQRPTADKNYRDRVVYDLSRSNLKAIGVIESVRKLRNIESRPYSLFVKTDVGVYIKRGVDKIMKSNPNLKISVRTGKRSILLKSDPSLEELLIACIETISSLKTDMNEEIIIDISQETKEHEIDKVKFEFLSRDIGLARWRKLAIDIRSIDSRSKRLPTSGDLFGKFLITFISRKYGGNARVEERLKDATESSGALVISLPIVS